MAKRASTPARRLRIMVSSTVHDIAPLLEQIFGILESFDYEVWMSHMGTIPNYSGNHAWTDCLEAVKNCDLFLSIITPRYGSGVADGQHGITHQELELAMQRPIPRWVVAHERVKIARAVFRKLGKDSSAARGELFNILGFGAGEEYKKMVRRDSDIIDDFRVIDMYELATQHGIPIENRVGNWVQEFKQPDDVRRYVSAQFHDVARVRDNIARIASASPASGPTTTSTRTSTKGSTTKKSRPSK